MGGLKILKGGEILEKNVRTYVQESNEKQTFYKLQISFLSHDFCILPPNSTIIANTAATISSPDNLPQKHLNKAEYFAVPSRTSYRNRGSGILTHTYFSHLFARWIPTFLMNQNGTMAQIHVAHVKKQNYLILPHLAAY